METYESEYGKFTLYKNDMFIAGAFQNNIHWESAILKELHKYIDPRLDILEIGAHCGTSTLAYRSFIHNDSTIVAFEPQKRMYDLLITNIKQNNVDNIIAINKGIFCYNGVGHMNDTDIDGKNGNIEECYVKTLEHPCNFGGVPLGKDGEEINLITLDSLLDDPVIKNMNFGFIHCDAQGSENFLFSTGKEFLRKYRPIIFFEDSDDITPQLSQSILDAYPEYKDLYKFNLVDFCMNELKYKKFNKRPFHSYDSILLP